MNAEDVKFKKQWEEIRLNGRLRYGLTHGSTFGFVIFILINLLQLKDNSFSAVYLNAQAILQMGYMIIAGILGYSTVKWWMNESIYKKISEKSI